MKLRSSPLRLPFALALVALLAMPLAQAAPSSSDFLGRWAITTEQGRPGWLEVTRENDWYDASLLWVAGSVTPAASVLASDNKLTVTRLREVSRRNAAGTVVRKHQLTDVLVAEISGDALKGAMTLPRADGSGVDRIEFTARRTPPMPAAPDLTKLRYGAPIQLFNGRDLTGWRLVEPNSVNGWRVEAGVLMNRPEQTPGQPHVNFGNLRTEAEFEDFNLALEVNIPAGSNSGVYLRGIYEIQVMDTYGKPRDPHNMGALYSRITPSESAEKPAGQWQKMDITLVDRHVTVVLNGVKIIDNQPAAGCTGGALWSDESRPGPLYLQGDHGSVDYRAIVLRPVVK